MSYGPAGYEDFDSDSDEFDEMYDYEAPGAANSNSYSTAGVQSTTLNYSARIPAGAEDDDSSDDEGIYFGSKTRSLAAREISDSTKYQNKPNSGDVKNRNSLPTAGKGRGRGRGGFPAPNTPARRDGGKPGQPRPRQQQQKQSQNSNGNMLMADELKVAVTNKNFNAVLKLLDRGVRTDAILKSGWTALMYAASASSSELVDLLVKHGANVNFQKDMYSVLMAACSASGNVEEDIFQCVQMLLENGARINVYDRYRMSPLMYAAKEGRVSVCEQLLENGAEMNRQDMRGWTALSWAASRGHGRLVRVLLDHKADVKIYSNDGQSPSDIAYTNGYTTIADILDAALTGQQRNQSSSNLSRDLEQRVDSSTSFDKCDDLQLFLRGLDLAHLLPTFQGHKITFEDLLKLTEKDLSQMGVLQVGVQKTILDAVRDVHKKEWDTASLQNVDKQTLSSLEATTILANIAKHLSFVQSSAVYVNKHLENVKQSAGFMQDVSQAEGMVKFSKEAAEIAANLSQQLCRVQEQVEGLSLEASQNAPDLITASAPAPRQSGLKHPGLLLMGAVLAVACGFLVVKRGYQQA